VLHITGSQQITIEHNIIKYSNSYMFRLYGVEVRSHCLQIYLQLAGVPGVARDDQWRNLIAFFPSITKEAE